MASGIPPPTSMVGTAAPDSFADRTVIVTGGAGKIGRAISRALGPAGANIIVVDINPELVKDFVEELTTSGWKASGITLSATKGPEIISQVIEKHGRVDAIINPIVAPFPWKNFEDQDEQSFRDTLESDVMGPISIVKAAWPHFKKQKYGRVVNFTSGSIAGMPLGTTYTLTKGAIFGVNRTLALEGAPFNITVNCISPIGFGPQPVSAVKDTKKTLDSDFVAACTPESNVPMVVTLASEACTANGEMFYTSGYGSSRTIWGVGKGFNGLRTVDDCLKVLPEMLKKNADLFEPKDPKEFTEYQVAYVLGKEFKPE
jgi:NAD(P)-dependent dehydrogenase (short-subunit alcohol dehydrogenase family)